jgi:hypothetical protein
MLLHMHSMSQLAFANANGVAYAFHVPTCRSKTSCTCTEYLGSLNNDDNNCCYTFPVQIDRCIYCIIPAT